MTARRTESEFHIESKLLGSLLATFTFYHDDGLQILSAVDDDGFEWFHVESDGKNTTEIDVLMSRIYEALNGYNDDHAAQILADFIDTGDEWFNIKGVSA